MKRTHYDAVITIKETVNGTFKHRYEGFKKIKYRLNGDSVKLWIYYRNGTLEIAEFTNVASIEIKKYKK